MQGAGRAIRIAFAAGLAGIALFAGGAAVANDVMDGGDIRRDLIGRSLTLAVPPGGSLTIAYNSDGQLTGAVDGGVIAGILEPKDQGRWWIDGARLCHQWQDWYGGEPMCFTATRTSAASLRWRYEDGRTGEANIGPPIG